MCTVHTSLYNILLDFDLGSNIPTMSTQERYITMYGLLPMCTRSTCAVTRACEFFITSDGVFFLWIKGYLYT